MDKNFIRLRLAAFFGTLVAYIKVLLTEFAPEIIGGIAFYLAWNYFIAEVWAFNKTSVWAGLGLIFLVSMLGSIYRKYNGR